MRCHLHSGELVPCSICSHSDLYMPKFYGKGGEIDLKEAALYWMGKYMEADLELQRMRKMQTDQKDR